MLRDPNVTNASVVPAVVAAAAELAAGPLPLAPYPSIQASAQPLLQEECQRQTHATTKQGTATDVASRTAGVQACQRPPKHLKTKTFRARNLQSSRLMHS